MFNVCNSIVFNSIVKAVKIWLKGQGEEVHPLVEEWVSHYFFGGSVDKTLPPNAVEETKQAVKEQLWELWDEPTWFQLNTAEVGDKIWYSSLAGVIGRFNYNMKIVEGGLQFSCWDLWDFNSDVSGSLHMEISHGSLRRTIIKIAAMLNLPIVENDSTLYVREHHLAQLNANHAFYTRWEFFVPFEELIENPEVIDWEKGGLPKWWIYEDALIRAATQLKLGTSKNPRYNEGEMFIYIGPEERPDDTIPLDWESINLFRKLSEEQLQPYQVKPKKEGKRKRVNN